MLHWFVIRGPIGDHLCLVFEALGPSISAILDMSPKYLKPGARVFTGTRFPLPMAKSILRQILLGISYLHSKHVIHGDIHCGNLLLVPPKLNLANADNLAPDKAEGNFPAPRLDDLSAPRYRVTTISYLSQANRGSDQIVQISDLGSGEQSARLGVIK